MKRFVPIAATLLLILIPVGLYFWIWDYLAVNVPKWDDHALKMFLLNINEAQSVSDHVKDIFIQHNEHRIALTRFLTWADVLVTGKLNYRHLMLAGNLLLLIIPVVWGLILHQNKKPLYCLIPVPFIWLTIAHWENMYWGMAAVQNFGVVAMAVLTCYLLVRNRNSCFLAAIAAAFITVFTSGNGLLILPVGFGLLLISKRWKYLSVWGVISVLFILLYFAGFEYPSATNPENRATIGQFIKGYMLFLGSAAEAFPFRNKQTISILLGSLLFLVALSIIFTSFFRLLRDQYENQSAKKADLFNLGVCLFIMGTAIIVVYGRAGFGIETLFTSRYKIYSFLLLLVGYLYVVLPIKGTFLYPYVTGIAVLSILYSIFSFHYHLVDASNLRKYLTTSKFNWTYNNKQLTDTAKNEPGGNLVAAEALFYDQWLPLLKEAGEAGYAGDTAQMSLIYRNSVISADSVSINISSATYRSQRLQDSGIYLLLMSKDRFYLYPTLRNRNHSRKTLFFDQQYFEAGYHNEIPMQEMDPGQYRLGMVWQQGKRVGIQFQPDSVTVLAVKEKVVHTNW